MELPSELAFFDNDPETEAAVIVGTLNVEFVLDPTKLPGLVKSSI